MSVLLSFNVTDTFLAITFTNGLVIDLLYWKARLLYIYVFLYFFSFAKKKLFFVLFRSEFTVAAWLPRMYQR